MNLSQQNWIIDNLQNTYKSHKYSEKKEHLDFIRQARTICKTGHHVSTNVSTFCFKKDDVEVFITMSGGLIIKKIIISDAGTLFLNTQKWTMKK